LTQNSIKSGRKIFGGAGITAAIDELKTISNDGSVGTKDKV